MSDPSQNPSETPADNAETSNSAAAEQFVKVEGHETQGEQCQHQDKSTGGEQEDPENQHCHQNHEHQPETKNETEDVKEKTHQEEHQSSDESKQDRSTDQLVQVAEGVAKEILEAADAQHLTEIVGENGKDVEAEGKEEHQAEKITSENAKGDQHTSTVGTSPIKTVSETDEVTSTTKDHQPRSGRSARRPSYTSGRGYAGGYQNYGLTYLPYKSNFEPSEDARRKADEFFKTLKLQ